jgi:UV radiation resistance-associated gene protein
MPSDIPSPKPALLLPTSSYSAIMRLSSLDDSIQDALATRESLATQINAILHDRPVDEAPQARDEAAIAVRFLTTERKHLKQSLKKRGELKASLQARKEAMKLGMEAQIHAQDDVNSALDKLKQCQSLLKTTTEDIHSQRRRICEELLHIFPIEPTSQSLLFTIIGLPLPNTSFDELDEDVLAAALGHVARLVDMLQYYLSVPLPYPITPYGSRSIIRDQISTLADSQRTFPLYIKGTVRYRFDYAVFLLNKNIERLAESQGLKVIDIRHTLPNLKYLLYICSAGSSELPARKAGGIRGLLSSRATPLPSRRGSEDAEHIEAARKALESTGAGKGKGQLKNTLATVLPIGIDQSTTLRTRGLRENAVR